MKVIVAGCRDYNDYDAMARHLSQLEGVTEIIHGGCRGVDSVAALYAHRNKIAVKAFAADWKKHGRSAGPIRNQQMADYASSDGTLVAFWDGQSRGTKNMIDTAKLAGMKIKVIMLEGDTVHGSQQHCTEVI